LKRLDEQAQRLFNRLGQPSSDGSAPPQGSVGTAGASNTLGTASDSAENRSAENRRGIDPTMSSGNAAGLGSGDRAGSAPLSGTGEWSEPDTPYPSTTRVGLLATLANLVAIGVLLVTRRRIA